MNEHAIDLYLFKAYMPDGQLSLEDRNRRVSETGRHFVRMHIAQTLGLHYESLLFDYGAHGKPSIPDCPLHFNLSHCGNVILAAFSPDEIGADIELINRSGRKQVMRAFMPDEQDYINWAANEIEARRRFAEIWTIKEAFLKFTGAGLSGGLQFTVADRGGLRDIVDTPSYGRVPFWQQRVTIPMSENDFLPKQSENKPCEAADFQICVCSREIGSVSLHQME